VLQSEYHTIKTKSVVMNDETLCLRVNIFVLRMHQNSHTSICISKKNFRLAIARHKGRKKKGRKGRGGGTVRGGKERGKGQGATAPQVWNSVYAPDYGNPMIIILITCLPLNYCIVVEQ
jgi:hypothetical protein